MTDEPIHATVHYSGLTYTIPAGNAEDILDAIYGLDMLGGSHLYKLGGAGGDDILYFWITSGVPIVVKFPNGYERPTEREDYVLQHLKDEARFRLGLSPESGTDAEPVEA